MGIGEEMAKRAVELERSRNFSDFQDFLDELEALNDKNIDRAVLAALEAEEKISTVSACCLIQWSAKQIDLIKFLYEMRSLKIWDDQPRRQRPYAELKDSLRDDKVERFAWLICQLNAIDANLLVCEILHGSSVEAKMSPSSLATIDLIEAMSKRLPKQVLDDLCNGNAAGLSKSLHQLSLSNLLLVIEFMLSGMNRCEESPKMTESVMYALYVHAFSDNMPAFLRLMRASF